MEYGQGWAARVAPRRVGEKAASELRKLATPLAVRYPPLRDGSFEVWGENYQYFLHKHNTTWANERAVELAVAKRFVERSDGGTLLEFGNVLSHYGNVAADEIVDRYEKWPGVLNIDVLEYEPDFKFDRIVSVSTIEHVGWDEPQIDEDKALSALLHLRSLLASNGVMFVTIPFGHHPRLDELIASGDIPTERQATLIRQSWAWKVSETPIVTPYRRGPLRPGAGSVWMAEIRR